MKRAIFGTLLLHGRNNTVDSIKNMELISGVVFQVCHVSNLQSIQPTIRYYLCYKCYFVKKVQRVLQFSSIVLYCSSSLCGTIWLDNKLSMEKHDEQSYYIYALGIFFDLYKYINLVNETSITL
jgi:hypothetical protein